MLSATPAIFMDKMYATSLEGNTSKTGIKRALLHVWSNTVLFADHTVGRGCYEFGYQRVWDGEPTTHKQETAHNSF